LTGRQPSSRKVARSQRPMWRIVGDSLRAESKRFPAKRRLDRPGRTPGPRVSRRSPKDKDIKGTVAYISEDRQRGKLFARKRISHLAHIPSLLVCPLLCTQKAFPRDANRTACFCAGAAERPLRSGSPAAGAFCAFRPVGPRRAWAACRRTGRGCSGTCSTG